MFLTPTYTAAQLVSVRDALEEYFGRTSQASALLAEYFAPLVALIVTFGLIPLLVDLFSEFEDFRRKSSKQISIMRRIYFLLFINLFILPITGRQIAELLREVRSETDVLSLPMALAAQFMNQ